MDEMKILCATGAVGYGIDDESLHRAVNHHDIDFIACDSGSNDSGPGNFAGSELGRSETGIKNDMRTILRVREKAEVPLLTGSTGVSGTKNHVDRIVEIVSEIAREEDLSFTLGIIYSDIDRRFLISHIEDGNVENIDLKDELSVETVKNAANIVGQIGYEPYLEALDRGADVILGGRSIDLAPFSAIPIREGYDRGLTYHLAKLLECGTASIKTRDGRGSTVGQTGVIGVLLEDAFEIVPTHPNWEATRESVAIQTLHEKADPETIWTPEGHVDISRASYEQKTPTIVRVTGSKFHASSEPTLLVEGVEHIGYRTIAIAGVPDPTAIDQIDTILDNANGRFDEINEIPDNKFKKRVRVYGTGESYIFGAPSSKHSDAEELGLVVDVIGESQRIANEVCKRFTNCIRKVDYPNKVNVGGNIALALSANPGKEIDAGRTYEWSIHHLLKGVRSDEIVDVKIQQIGEEVF